VARIKITARPMTTEELAAAGVPPASESIFPSTDNPIFEDVRESGSHEDGEIEANLNELIGFKSSYPVTCFR
jgi:hypothetical protein